MGLDLEEHASERALLDEVPKGRRSVLKRECLRDDRVDMAGLEKIHDLHPCFRPGRGRFPEKHEALDARAPPDQIGHPTKQRTASNF